MALCLGSAGISLAENIDPDGDGSQYAYGENVGWMNAEPNGDGGDGVQVSDYALTGWMWGENTGWISLSCQNTTSCATVDYGVSNDGCGNLAGYAWAENLGWINFSPSTSGVVIDPQTGDFSGRAWGENVGWVSFASAVSLLYRMQTGWRRLAPTGVPDIVLGKSSDGLLINWPAVANADGYDVFQGSLAELRSTAGDFATSTDDCLADDQVGTSYQQSMSIGTTADFFLVRAINCGGNGTCDCGEASQVGERDGEIAYSGTCQ